MNSAFICTQGTSISNGFGSGLENLAKLQRELQGRTDPWDFNHAEFEKELGNKLKSMPEKELSAVSAELTILSKKGVSRGDKIVLLCSDGYLGRVTGDAIKATALKIFDLDESDIEVVRVPDLQVKDAEKLSKLGLKNFVESARKEIEKFIGIYTVYLCPNGGYKGVVPFLTLLGMQYHCSVLYTFEFANSVVTLPPLPYCFDRELYLRARKALVALAGKVEMREEEYLGNIEGYEDSERDLFLGFVQYATPGVVTPSPLVDSFVSASEVTDAMLSRQAFDDLEREKHGNNYQRFCRMILNSQDPIWRQKNIHTFNMSDLIGIKPYHSSLRLLGYMVGQRYYVARVLQHAEYERAIESQYRKDFPAGGFSLWTPPVEMDEAGSNLSTESELLDKNDTLVAKVHALENELLSSEENCEKAKADAAMAQEAAARARDTAAKAENALQAMNGTVERLKSNLVESELRATSFSEEITSLKASLSEAKAKLALPWYRRIFVK